MVAPTTARGVSLPAAGTQEGTLLPALRQGDERALLALVERHDAAMLRFARRRSSDPAIAEDAVQDAWIGVLRGLHRFEPRAALRSWIFGILLNRLRSHLRHEGRSIPFSRLNSGIAEPESLPGTAPDQQLFGRELLAVLGRAVSGLPPAQRTVIVLRDVEGWTADEVCRRLKVTAGHQRVLLHRARVKIRRTLADYLVQE